MMIDRRVWLSGMAGAFVARAARADDYPARPIRVIVPYAPGGATDVLARLIAVRLDQELKQSVVVDNRGGGASQVGTQAIATAAADGYTLGMIDSAFTINPGLFGARLPYDTLRDFAPVSLIATAPLALVVNAAVPVASAAELVALARQNPGGLGFALPGLGTPVHLAGEQLRQVAGIDVIPVPYRGAGPSIADLIAGQVQITFATIPSILEHVRAGRVRALAIIGPRSALLPQVPSMAEIGFADIDAALMFGLVAPAATPAAIVDRLSEAAARCVRTEPLRSRLDELGYVAIGSSAAEFGARIRSDITKWTSLIEARNIRPN